LATSKGKVFYSNCVFPKAILKREHAVAAELVRLNVDVIVTVGSNATRAAKEATATIPIVMTQDPDPVGNRFVASLGRPGGNITGLSNLNRELSGKRLELLKEIVPRLSRVAVFGTSTQPGHPQARKETELASAAFGVKLQYLDVLEPKDIEAAFRAAAKGRAEAILGLGGRIEFATVAGGRTCGKAPAPGNVQHPILCRRRRTDELRC
jgi:putative ABC transport system substrate-binding protein